jgi:hypothetical protein
MVLKFRLISNEQDDFIRDFEILAGQTFFDLHMAIMDNLHYDKTQIASFIICSPEWEKQQEITLFELSEEESAKVVTMDNALIGDYMREVHDKMIYVFDVFNERMFFAECVEKRKKDPSRHYPFCSHQQGKAPQQLLMEQLFGPPDLTDSAIIDDMSYGEGPLGIDDPDTPDFDPQIFDDDLPDEY